MRMCVLIPAKDEASIIGSCIQSVVDARILPSNIFLVDDGSSDETAAIAAEYGVTVMRNPRNVGKAKAIQDGCEHFRLADRYDAVTLLDADTLVDKSYFLFIRKRMESDPGIAAVCGQHRSMPYNGYTAYRAYQYFVAHAVYKPGQSRMGVITVAPGCSTTYRASVLSAMDVSQPTLAEDMDMTYQILSKNLGRVVYEPDAVVVTQDPRTLREYVGQVTRWYTGTWQVIKKHRIPFHARRIDAEFALLLGEGVLFSLVTLCFPVIALLYPRLALWSLGLDAAVMSLICAYIAARHRRADVLCYSPLFYAFRALDCAILLRTLFRVMSARSSTTTWFSVSRYLSRTQKGDAA